MARRAARSDSLSARLECEGTFGSAGSIEAKRRSESMRNYSECAPGSPIPRLAMVPKRKTRIGRLAFPDFTRQQLNSNPKWDTASP